MIWREFSRGYTRHARCSSIIESDLLAQERLLERERQRSKLGRRCHTLPPACSHWAWGKSTRKLILATPPLIEVPRERSCRSAACWATQQSQKPVQDSADTHSLHTTQPHAQPRCLALVLQLALDAATDIVLFTEAFSTLRH